MKKIFLSIVLSFFMLNAHASFFPNVLPHEIMFINCTLQPVQVTNGATKPYKISMDPLFEARSGYSPSYSFVIPAQMMYKHPITIYTNWFYDAYMKMYLTGGVTAEINVTHLRGDYILYRTDFRYVTLLGYNENWVPYRGTRSIIGLGCENEKSMNGIANMINANGEFKVGLGKMPEEPKPTN